MRDNCRLVISLQVLCHYSNQLDMCCRKYLETLFVQHDSTLKTNFSGPRAQLSMDIWSYIYIYLNGVIYQNNYERSAAWCTDSSSHQTQQEIMLNHGTKLLSLQRQSLTSSWLSWCSIVVFNTIFEILLSICLQQYFLFFAFRLPGDWVARIYCNQTRPCVSVG